MGTAVLNNFEDSRIFEDSLDTFLDSLGQKKDLDTLWQEFLCYVKTYSVDAVTYYHIPPAGALDFQDRDIVSLGFDQSALDLHKEIYDSINSPLTDRTRMLRQPEFWPKAIKTLELNAGEREHFKDYYCSRESCNGMVVPVHGSAGRNGCVVLRFIDNNVRLNAVAVRKVKWASLATHEAYCRIKSELRTTKITLTRREQEILTWVARGKSNSAIAGITGISYHTVNGYLRRIFLKTSTSDRTTATLRALGESLIDY